MFAAVVKQMISATLPKSRLRVHGGSSRAGSMAPGSSNRLLAPALKHISAWVLDRPLQRDLHGQCCDRLRPAPIGLALREALRANGHGNSELLEWHWDHHLGRAEGWLWQQGVVQHFRWYRRDGRLAVRAQLRCSERSTLQLLA